MASSEWLGLYCHEKHNRAKRRFPTLKNQGARMIPVQSYIIP